jgi:hypothetical protein
MLILLKSVCGLQSVLILNYLISAVDSIVKWKSTQVYWVAFKVLVSSNFALDYNTRVVASWNIETKSFCGYEHKRAQTYARGNSECY